MTNRGFALAIILTIGLCATHDVSVALDDRPPEPDWVAGKVCGEDDCDNIPGRWRATAPSNIYDQPDSAARVVAHIAQDEWVKAIEKKTRYSPQRGLVRTLGNGLAVGDVVYGPFPGGDESHEQVWSNGQRVTIETSSEAGPKIDWDAPAPDAPMRVMWVRVERADGTGGWLRDPENFACMGEHPAADEGC